MAVDTAVIVQAGAWEAKVWPTAFLGHLAPPEVV
jgi:hypothetical protein